MALSIVRHTFRYASGGLARGVLVSVEPRGGGAPVSQATTDSVGLGVFHLEPGEYDFTVGSYRVPFDVVSLPSVSIGTVETLAPGTPAEATMTGDPPSRVLNLGLPAGQPGPPGEDGPPGPAGPAGAGSATLEQVKHTMSLGGRLFVDSPKAFWVDWKYVGDTTPDPVPITMPPGAMLFGFVGGDIAWMLPNEDFTEVTIGGDAHGGWEFTPPAGVWPMGVFGGVAYLMNGGTGEFYWTDGTAAPALITGGTLSVAGALMQGWFIDSGGDWYRVDTATGAWIIATPPAGVGPQYAYPIPETGDTVAWDGSGWHHLSVAGVWTSVAGGPAAPTAFGGAGWSDTEVWIGDATPGDGRWWSPGGGWRADNRNYAYTQMWGLTDGALWTDGTDWWRTTSGGWWNTPAPDPLLGFDQFTGSKDNLVGYNLSDGYWGYSTNGNPWVLGLRERVYLLEQGGGGVTIQDTDYTALIG